MRASRILLCAVVIAILGLCATAADTHPAAPTNSTFEKVKSLAGDWTSTTPDGKTFTNTYRVTSGGSAVMITALVPGEGDMITMVSPDGANLVATHYCIAGNQPRYLATPGSDPNVITLNFKDITNLAKPEGGHMHSLVIKIVDADHHTASWTWRANGKEQVETFALVRKK